MQADITAFLAHNRNNIDRVVVLQVQRTKHHRGCERDLGEDARQHRALSGRSGHRHQRPPAGSYHRDAGQFTNELSPAACGAGVLDIFAYNAPASLRVVLFEHLLYIGAYFYKVASIAGRHQLDIRGGEMPLLAVPSANPNFAMLSREVLEMVQNWTSNGIAVSVEHILKKRA